jgi:hypothetical protein
MPSLSINENLKPTTNIIDQSKSGHSGARISGFRPCPLINKSAFTIGIFTAENAYSLIGSGFSILVGATFLIAAVSSRRMRSGSESPIQQIDANLF